MTIEIKVGGGLVALVDDEDGPKVGGMWWQRHRKGARVYARSETEVDGKRIRLMMHRLILDLRPGEFCDHVDGDGLNNTRGNLRKCTHSENMRNRIKRKTNPGNPYKGVYLRKGRWICMIRDPGLKRQVVVGVFEDAVSAARAYDREAARLFGEFARPNFPVDAVPA